MRIKLGSKIGLTYLVIIFTVMLLFAYFTLLDIEQSFINERKNALLSYANIIAERAAPYLPEQDTADLNYLAEDFGENIGHRVLIFDSNGIILGDSSGLNRAINQQYPRSPPLYKEKVSPKQIDIQISAGSSILPFL